AVGLAEGHVHVVVRALPRLVDPARVGGADAGVEDVEARGLARVGDHVAVPRQAVVDGDAAADLRAVVAAVAVGQEGDAQGGDLHVAVEAAAGAQHGDGGAEGEAAVEARGAGVRGGLRAVVGRAGGGGAGGRHVVQPGAAADGLVVDGARAGVAHGRPARAVVGGDREHAARAVEAAGPRAAHGAVGGEDGVDVDDGVEGRDVAPRGAAAGEDDLVRLGARLVEEVPG